MKNFKIEPKNILRTFRIEEESNMYIYNLNGKEVLLKLFTTDNEEKLESKRKKIEIMSENKAINDEMGNIGNAIFDGKIVGYFMPIDMEYVRPISEYDRRKDKIVVLKEGVVAEQGKPQELKQQKGIYKHMVDMQMQSNAWKYQ